LVLLSSGIPIQEKRVIPRESSAVVPGEQQRSSDDKRRVSLTNLNENKSTDGADVNIIINKTVSRSHEHIDENVVTDVPVVVSRKDAVYQGSLHNIPLYNEDTDEYHDQMIQTSDEVTDELEKNTKKVGKSSFFAKLAGQIDLSLLNDGAFALFAVSNFLTSLGFNVPYSFANDVASDAHVVEHRRKWIIMTIGIANCFGRVIIGYLADRPQVKTHRSFLYHIYRFSLD
jgi:hypothetical protein